VEEFSEVNEGVVVKEKKLSQSELRNRFAFGRKKRPRVRYLSDQMKPNFDSHTPSPRYCEHEYSLA
jgi:hypothetical protein